MSRLANYTKLTVVELKKELDKRKLPKAGVKSVLIQRLTDNDAEAKTTNNYSEWTVTKLKSELGKRKLSKTGSKDALIQRLIDDDNKTKSAAAVVKPVETIDYSKWKLTELKDELGKRGLSKVGSKAVLIKRLVSDGGKMKKSEVNKSQFTGLRDTNAHILLNLRYEDIVNACNTNKEMAAVCEDDYFWRQLVERDFGEFGVIALRRPTQDNITYKKQYEDLIHVKDNKDEAASDALYYGRIDILEYLFKTDFDFLSYDYNTKNNIDALIKYNPNLEREPGRSVWDNLYPLRHNNDIDVLSWLIDHKIRPRNTYTASTVEALSFLHKGNHIDSDYVESDVVLRGSIESLNWLKSNGYEITQHGLETALGERNFKVANWYVDNGITVDEGELYYLLRPDPDTEDVGPTLQLLDWLGSRDLITDEVVSLVLELGIAEAEPILAKYNLLPLDWESRLANREPEPF